MYSVFVASLIPESWLRKQIVTAIPISSQPPEKSVSLAILRRWRWDVTMMPISDKQAAADVYRLIHVALSPASFLRDLETVEQMAEASQTTPKEVFELVHKTDQKWTYTDYFEDWTYPENFGKVLAQSWDEFSAQDAKSEIGQEASKESETQTGVCKASSAVSSGEVADDAKTEGERCVGTGPIASRGYVPKDLFTKTGVDG